MSISKSLKKEKEKPKKVIVDEVIDYASNSRNTSINRFLYTGKSKCCHKATNLVSRKVENSKLLRLKIDTL